MCTVSSICLLLLLLGHNRIYVTKFPYELRSLSKMAQKEKKQIRTVTENWGNLMPSNWKRYGTLTFCFKMVQHPQTTIFSSLITVTLHINLNQSSFYRMMMPATCPTSVFASRGKPTTRTCATTPSWSASRRGAVSATNLEASDLIMEDQKYFHLGLIWKKVTWASLTNHLPYLDKKESEMLLENINVRIKTRQTSIN